MTDWQPIATAPKDGRPLWLVEDGQPLGFVIPHQFVGFWTPESRYTAGGFWQVHAHSFNVGQPTHWMPLPDPPAALTESPE